MSTCVFSYQRNHSCFAEWIDSTIVFFKDEQEGLYNMVVNLMLICFSHVLSQQTWSRFFGITVRSVPGGESGHDPQLHEDRPRVARCCGATCGSRTLILSIQGTLSGWWFGTFFIFPYTVNSHTN